LLLHRDELSEVHEVAMHATAGESHQCARDLPCSLWGVFHDYKDFCQVVSQRMKRDCTFVLRISSLRFPGNSPVRDLLDDVGILQPTEGTRPSSPFTLLSIVHALHE
jgi:hypothetical protein